MQIKFYSLSSPRVFLPSPDCRCFFSLLNGLFILSSAFFPLCALPSCFSMRPSTSARLFPA